MKNGKLLSLSICLMLMAGVIIFNSNSGGITGTATAGCSCHGPSSTATTMTLTGIPASGWVAGNTYPLTFTVLNATKPAAGFTMSVSSTSGSIANASANSTIQVFGGFMEMRHTSPKPITAGSASWTFDWTAPTVSTSNQAIFKVSANAVNLDSTTNGDDHSLTTFTFPQAPTRLTHHEIENANLILYPNPCTTQLNIVASNNHVPEIYMYSVLGSRIPTLINHNGNNTLVLNVQHLPKGQYLILLKEAETITSRIFSKE